MGYRRLDINLLPPELQPGPVVRYAVVINTIFIGVTVAFLLVDSFLGLTVMGSLKRDVELKQELIRAKSGVIADYDELKSIEGHVNSIGRLIALASADYIDLPVLLDHVTRILPDGVYVESVSSQRGGAGTNTPGPTTATTAELRINLATSRRDPQLIVKTINAFKSDELLGDCLLRTAAPSEADLAPVLLASGINWEASGPDVADYSEFGQFGFQILTTLYPPISTEGMAVTFDNTHNFDVVSSLVTDAKESGSKSSNVTGAPEGVSVMEAN